MSPSALSFPAAIQQWSGEGGPGTAACVFAAFDAQSRVHDVTLRYLEALKALGYGIVYVTTSAKIEPEDVERLRQVCAYVVHRRNVGYDFLSWKIGLGIAESLGGLARPVLFTNDSLLGPVRSLEPSFQRIRAEPAVLWGMTDSTELGTWHLQSFFLHAPSGDAAWLREFFEQVTVLGDKSEIIRRYEVGFTEAARKAGVECRALFPSAEVVSRADALGYAFQYRSKLAEGGVNTTLFMWDILVRDFDFPFVKAELIRDDRFGSKALLDWPAVVAGASPEVVEGLVAFEGRALWGKVPPPPRAKAELGPVQARLRDVVSERPWLRPWIHRARTVLHHLRLLKKPEGRRFVRESIAVGARQLLRDRFARPLLAGEERSRSRNEYFAESRRALAGFLFAGEPLDLAPLGPPRLTIVLILFNKAELTFRCLRSLAALRGEVPFEVLLIDNGSTDQTDLLLKLSGGARIHRNRENLGFLRACNQARDLVETELMLLLNNDTEVHTGSLAAAVRTMDLDAQVGAVGARIVLPGGRLQEAGNIIWRDGNCEGYARGLDALAPESMFVRDVDYCSGAFLLTRTQLFRELGGFDEDYAPAYYEETDFCIRLQKAGHVIRYQPRAAITHVEFGSAELSQTAFDMMNRNRVKLCAKHADYLAGKLEKARENVLVARDVGGRQARRLLIIDDRVPHAKAGAGYPRANRILQTMLGLGYQVTIGCTEAFDPGWFAVYTDVPDTVELVPLLDRDSMLRFLSERLGDYDVVWLSRPGKMEPYQKALARLGPGKRRPFLIHDAEAFFSMRSLLKAKIFGWDESPAKREYTAEVKDSAAADLIVAVSEADRVLWQKETGRPAVVVGHDADPEVTPAGFEQRAGILFVGALHGLDSPNGDSVCWFMSEVMPHLRKRLGPDVELHVAGYVEPHVRRLLSRRSLQNFRLLGAYDDPRELFDRYRVMVIPTRYAAGIPQKAFDAATLGLPTVCSPIIAEQMGWTDGVECLTGSLVEPERFAEACVRLSTERPLWESVRTKAAEYLVDYSQKYSIDVGMRAVAKALEAR